MRFRTLIVAGTRAAALAALAAAAFHLPVPGPRSPVLRCYVLDVSGSMFWGRHTDPEALATLLSADAAAGAGADWIALVAYAGRPALLFPPSPAAAFAAFLRQELAPLLERGPAAVRARGLEPDASHPAAALDLALSLRMPRLPLEIVLISDGGQTGGDALSAAARVRREGASLTVLPAGPAHPPEVRLDAASAPRSVAPGAAFDLAAVASSTTATEVEFTVRRDDEPIAGARHRIAAGGTIRAVFPGLRLDGRASAFEVCVLPPPGADLCEENNRLAVHVEEEKPGTRPALYLGPPGPRALEAALAGDARFEVTRDPGAGDAGRFALVVLDDISWNAVPGPVRSSLPGAVTHRGTGLLVAGGPEGLASASYAGSDVEPILPVWAVPDERLALAVVVDRSGSMGGLAEGRTRKIDVAREALRRALPLLRAEDRLAVLSFCAGASGADADVTVHRPPLPPPAAGEFDRILREMRTRHGTRLAPALQRAAALVAGAGAGHRHILLITDGETPETPDDLRPVADLLRREGVTLTAVLTGASPSDPALSALLPDAAAGRRLAVSDWSRLESLIEEDLRRKKELVVPGPVAVEPVGGAVLAGGLAGPPDLGAANRTTLRAEGTPVLRGPRGTPVLATRQSGAGRVAVLATALDLPGWGGPWLSWQPSLSTLLGRLFDHLARADAGEVDIEAVRDATGFAVIATWRDPHAEPLPSALEAVAKGPDGAEERATLARTSARRYDGRLPASRPGSYAIRVATNSSETTPGRTVGSASAIVPYASEWHAPGRDTALLRRIADAGAGSLASGVDGLRAGRPRRAAYAPAFAACVGAALALLVLDLALVSFWR